MLRTNNTNRSLKENLMLGSSTAFVSGITNVIGVLAFLVFTANVTGHVANLAKNILQQEMHEIIIFAVWLLMFFSGAFIANFMIRFFNKRSSYYANGSPIFVEIAVLLCVAIYGHHFYEESQLEREIVISAILFSMGLQNGMVSNVSGGLIKTSHLTGLFTDLGSDLAEWTYHEDKKTKTVRNRILVRITILASYVIGGLAGGFLFSIFDLAVFYIIPVILLTIVYYDISSIALHKIGRRLPWKNPINNQVG